MINKIKEAINVKHELLEIVNNWQGRYVNQRLLALDALFDFAERYISIEAKMPEKLKVIYNINKHEETYVNAWNDAIDDCTLATTKILAEKDEELKTAREGLESAHAHMDMVESRETRGKSIK